MAWTYTYDLITGAIGGGVNNIIPLSQYPPDGIGFFRDPDITNPDGSVAITAHKDNVMVDLTQNPPALIPAPVLPPPYPQQAQAALDSSDITLLRCVENGIAIPAEWAAYRKTLRAIIEGSQTGPLPSRPAYPAGS